MANKSFIAPFGISERVLAGGRVIVPGEPFEMSAEELADDHNKRVFEEGKVQEYKKPQKSEGGDK
jgi:hypothetical protein